VAAHGAVACGLLSKGAIEKLMDEVTFDLTAALLYQTELVIVPFTNPLIRLESLSFPGALLGKQTRRQSGSLTFQTFNQTGNSTSPTCHSQISCSSSETTCIGKSSL